MEMAETDNVRKHHMDNPWPRYLVAGFLAIVLHMICLLFVEAPDAEGAVFANVKHVTLLPLDTKLLSEKKLLEWMKIMDPMHVIKPDRKNGFSFAPDPIKPKDMDLIIKKHYSKRKKGSFLPISAPVESYRNKVKRFWDYTSASAKNPSFSIPKRPEKDYPLWILENGRILPQLFTHFDQVKSILNKHKSPLKETVLRLESYDTGFFPRIKIDVSCGNAELDRLALKTFAIKGKFLFESEANNTYPRYIAVKWKTCEM
jgi:hypothetical protein